MRRILLTAILILCMSSFLFAQVVQQIPDAGTINWQDQVIRSSGIGAPNPKMPLAAQRAGAIEAAKRVALRNLLETVKGMQITSETTVNNMMVENDVIITRVTGIVKNFRIVDTRYMSDGSVEVEVEVPMSGILADAVLPQWGQPQNVGVTYPVSPEPTNVVYSGLIIDARGAGVRPAMAPKITDQNGNEVYGTGYVSRDYAVQIGVVGYEKDINRAAKNERVAANPMVVKAVSSSGANNNDVVISNADAQRVVAAAKNLNFMEQCKVMIILD